MINSVTIIGRLTKDPEIRTVGTKSDYVCNFTLAVEDSYSKEKKTDFIPCVCWGKKAQAMGDYQRKGYEIGVSGKLRTRTYDNSDGKKSYVTEILVEELQFLTNHKKDETDTQAFDTKSSPAAQTTVVDESYQQRNLMNYESQDNSKLQDDDLPF
jgi:single stranded DNA-binding protein (ssb)